MYFYDIEWIDNYFDKHCIFIQLKKRERQNTSSLLFQCCTVGEY